jgi:hypothetical protein
MRTLIAIIVFAFESICLAQTAEPNLSLSVNGSLKAEVHRGWPIIIRTTLLHPQFGSPDSPPPVDLGNFQIEVRGTKGDLQQWPVTLLDLSDVPVLRLDSHAPARLTFVVAPDDSSGFESGLYSVVAKVGAASSLPATVQISAEPVTVTSAEESWKARLLASYLAIQGRQEEAFAIVSTFLEKQPEDILALILKGDLVAAAPQNRTMEAWLMYSKAAEILRRNDPKSREAPAELLIRQRAMLMKLLADSQQ